MYVYIQYINDTYIYIYTHTQCIDEVLSLPFRQLTAPLSLNSFSACLFFNCKQVRIRAEQVVLRKGKIRPPRYPTTNRLDVRHLNSFLLT
jgi:hypothetical protein